MGLQVRGNPNQKQMQILEALSKIETSIMAVLTHIPECTEKEQATHRFHEGLMWAGSSVNRLEEKTLDIPEAVVQD